jgi:hypothetical protein
MIVRHTHRELWAALLAVLIITLLYGLVTGYLGSIPPASELFGHAIGILGFLLMIMTETLYSLRKRSRTARWGRMSAWLNFHIFTGIVGPYMVLLHTAWQFNGLAGVATWLTLTVVLSGFVGRYIYTSIPRSSDGVELESAAIQQEIEAIQASLEGLGPSQDRQLKGLQKRQNTLRRQTASLAATRRFLATWHIVHIPLGMALFAAAFVHILAAMYYATFLH